MGVLLSEGGNVSLTKAVPGRTAVVVGLGWDVRSTAGTDVDLDASALLVGRGGAVLSDAHLVFFNDLSSPDGAVEHTGDDPDEVVLPVSIYDADRRRQSFNQDFGANVG